ncbi:MAG TPA: FtsQ-type POTRA domain-containing protein [Terriglobia bacterium]|nr:FtsQ-type POTRA domain-containing protein [Terriglobia bacterium]
MARKSSPTIEQEELYSSVDDVAVDPRDRETLDDARLVDLDVEQESPFLRGQKRVSARRGPLPKKALSRLRFALIAAAVLCVAGIASAAAYHYGERSWRFRIESSDDIEITGTHNVTHAQIIEVLGGDIGRNVFFIPLAERKAQLEKIPWVESASVMRFVPNHLKVEIHERTPVAFARIGSRISLIDATGTLMELPGGKHKYSLPVIVGMNPGEPLSTRGARMKTYNELVRQLDSEGGRYSQDLSEVDVSDPDDVKVVANDPNGAVLVHLGSDNFLSRYRTYVTHVQVWRQQFEKLDSVDLRYDNQIIVNPDNPSTRTPQLTPAAARAAIAAGVKPAALLHVISTRPTPTPAKLAAQKPPAGTSAPKPKAPKAASKRTKPAHSKTAARTAARKPTAAAKTTAKPAPTHAVSASAKPGPKSEGKDAASSRLPATSASAAGKKPSPAIAKNQDQKPVTSPASGQQDHP